MCLRRHQSGFLLAEVIVAFIILAALLIGFALTLHGFKQFNHYQFTRQHCLAAVQAQLDALCLTGQALPDEDLQTLWPRVTVTTRTHPGEGQWQGLYRHEVTAQASSFHRVVRLSLSRYSLQPAENL